MLKGVSIVGLYLCEHHWDTKCECRKPKPGMINQATSDYQIKREGLVYIGDELKDYDAAVAAGITGVVIGEFEGPNVYPDLKSAYEFIRDTMTR